MQVPSRGFEPGAEDAGDAGCVRRRDAAGHLPALPVDEDNGWISASRPPYNDTPQLPIAVIGVVDDPMYRMNGDEPFRDVVHYWQEKKLWTVTHMGRGDVDAHDFPVKVKMWQPFAELPPPWSDLWKGTPA
jgi:hypothetical protein